jgi:hypothetical protein
LWKNKIFNKRNLPEVVTVCAFFFAFVLCGSLIYKDYGVSLDEQVDYIRGQINYERFSGGSLADFQIACQYNHTICYYPPFFSMVLYMVAPGGDSQAIFLARHLMTFAFFAFSVFIFFLVGKKIFKDWKLGLLGSLFLIISPRIFAHSFYNPKDIPCLSAYIIAIYTMLLLLEKKNVLTALLHGVAIGVLCSIRTPGLVIIPITFLFYAFDLFLSRAEWKSYLRAATLLALSLEWLPALPGTKRTGESPLAFFSGLDGDHHTYLLPAIIPAGGRYFDCQDSQGKDARLFPLPAIFLPGGGLRRSSDCDCDPDEIYPL